MAGVVAPISKYDVILGKPWLYKHNPKIDFRKNDVEFNDADQDTRTAEPATKGLAPTGEMKEELIAEQARVDEESDLFFMTVKAARKAIRKGADWYMLRVQDLCSEESEAEIHLLDAKSTIGVSGPERDELMELLQKHDQILTKEQVNNEIDVESGSILILRYCTTLQHWQSVL